MGYRSTFITTASFIKLPEWFVEKYESSVWMAEVTEENTAEPYKTLPIASKQEGKMYGMFSEFIDDLQRVLDEQVEGFSTSLTLMVLHEDGEHQKYVLKKRLYNHLE